MPRYLVERTFSESMLPGADDSAYAALIAVENNTCEDVTWICSFVALERSKSFCIYDAPTPEAVRRAAQRNNLPVGRISEVRTLDPYRYP